MRVLITRPEPDASAFAALCEQQGLTPIKAPVMEIVVKTRTLELQDVGALAFTSANGVRAFCANSDHRSLPVFAVGAATAAAARAAGFKNVRVAEGDVSALTALIRDARADIDGAVLHIAGAHRAGDLAANLEALGIASRRDVLYEAREIASLPKAAKAALAADPPVEWAAFFSPRAASLFLRLVADAGLQDRLRQVRAACLSEAVAAAAGKASWRAVGRATETTAEGLLALIAAKQGARDA